MAEVRCPKCGRDNPDLLDVCQFCQTPLKTDSVLHIGQTPTKKNTGELESVLPDWLRDVRQQARDSADEDQAAAPPKAEKEEPLDFLAGLASQSGETGDEEIPDWLASINPAAKPATPPAGTTPSAPPASGSDFVAQFDQGESPRANEPSASSEADELSKWFSQAAEQPEEIIQVEPGSERPGDAAWVNPFDIPLPSRREPEARQEEDLGWLHDLEASAKETGDLQAPKQGSDWMSGFEQPSAPAQPSGGQEDLSWLNQLGGIEEAQQHTPPTAPAPGDDLSWLSNLGGDAEPQPFDAAPQQPVSAPPFVSEEDLSWLGNLDQTSDAAPSAESARGTASSQEDLSWLDQFGGEQAAPFTAPFVEPEAGAQATPRQTAPLGKGEVEPPDWLKSAMEAPALPAPGDVSLDWFANPEQAAEEKAAPASQTPQPPPFSDLFATPSEASAVSSEDVDSLFSVEMPDWLSHSEPAAEGRASEQTALPPPDSGESLAPVDLPSWVQAMRPVEAVISPTAPGAEDEPAETQGPLAGLRGVIPGMAIGSSVRPKPVSLKLQATDEQQTSAALLEKILASETSPRALITPAFIASQQVLRWLLAGLFLLVLSAVIFLGSQTMQVSADLPPAGDAAVGAVESLAPGARVLVVIDYEPSLAGELEAIGGPLLDQMATLRNPDISFVSTSPSGAGLVQRLMSNTRIDQRGLVYHNLGFLPGGSAGVLGFVESPGVIIPASGVGKFSDYAMLILMSDHAESSRVWVEQLHAQRTTQIDPALDTQPLIVIASAQAGPLLQPYLSSGQINGMISGLSEAARYEYMNVSRPGIARSYWDAFGIGLMMSIALIVIGSLWSLFTGIRARRAEAEQG